MSTPEYGVTPQGFKAKRLIDIKNELDDYFIGEFGEINLDPQSVAGQIIGVYSKVLADLWENLQDVYLSQYPNSASGISLDNVVQYNGITRLSAQQTSVVGVATGSEGTLITAGKLARLPDSGSIFVVTENSIITRSNSVQNVIRVDASAPQVYSILINSIPYSYSRPIMQFSTGFSGGQSINVKVNGVNIPTTNYAGGAAATLNALRTNLLTSPAIAAADIVGNTITITPTLGFHATISGVEITGPTPPVYTQGLALPHGNPPDQTATVAQYLAALIDQSAVASATSDNNFITVTARDVNTPYSINTGTNLTITQISSPVPFLAQEYGVIPAPAGSLTEILTPVAGWQSITNFNSGVTGREQETDEELRIRRANSLRLLGSGTVEAIRSRILQEVPGVTSVLVFENVTMTQADLNITFSADFSAPSTITVLIDGVNVGLVTWQGSQLATMNAIAFLLQSRPEIASATVGGLGNQQLTVGVKTGNDVILDFAIGGANAPTYVSAGGRPPKSFETVVEGGLDSLVAQKIWELKPAGIQTFGNTSVAISDSQGNQQIINFSRATPIYIWVNVQLTLNPQEPFPSNGQQQVANAILAYGNSLGIGVDVFLQRVQAAIFSVPGIAEADVLLARTLIVNDVPVFASNNIPISETETSVWDLSRIVVSI